MKQHRFDPLSFTFGLSFAAAALLLSVEGLDFGAPGLRWLAAGGLLLLGILMIATSRTGSRER